MKRSEVNSAIKWAKSLLKKHNITLPPFAYWHMDDWQQNKEKCEMVFKAMLGWDVTDYGLDTFDDVGGVLFTVRNGSLVNAVIGVPYAEKFILLKAGQALPMHFHFSKTEDIINRAGGVLALKLYSANDDESIDYESDVTVYRDGIKHIVGPGEVVKVPVGGSITLTPRMYHSFWAMADAGDLVVGEVSSINDDNVDNRFNPPMPRFGQIVEDEAKTVPLCNAYHKL